MTPAREALAMGRPQDASAEVLVVAAWGGVAGFRARVTYSTSRGDDRTSLGFSNRDAVLALVAQWLADLDDDSLRPAVAREETAGPPPPP